MTWYYAVGSERAGPVSENELRQLVQRGTVTPGTLVWREGMANWQPFATALLTSASPPILNGSQCAECQQEFSTNDMLLYGKVYVCANCKPTFFQKLREGVTPGGGVALWQSGRFLVMKKDAVLPGRCIKCNTAGEIQMLRRKLYWHSPFWYLLIVVNLLIYAIVAMIIRRRARIEIGLCAEHVGKRRRDLFIAWFAAVLSVAALFLAGMSREVSLGVVGVALLLAGAIYGLLRCPMVSPQRIDEEFIWLKGVNPEFLSALPQWPGKL